MSDTLSDRNQFVRFQGTLNESGVDTAQAFAPTGLTGATAASRYVGATTSGAPLTGTFAVGDFVIDRTGKVWVCSVAGTPGTWVQAGPAAGTYVPVGDTTGVTVNTTTYDNGYTGVGKYTTLVFPPAASTSLIAAAVSGEAFPRLLLSNDPGDFMLATDGTVDPQTSGASLFVAKDSANTFFFAASTSLRAATSLVRRLEVSPVAIITSGALPTLTITSGTGRQILTTRDAETVTPFTGDGTNNTATCAIALSPDNVTYSTMATISIAAALNLTGVLTDTVNCRVPAGWYIKLTAVHGTIGTTTYY